MRRPFADAEAPVVARLSTLHPFLPVWILAAMGLGLGLGRGVPSTARVGLRARHRRCLGADLRRLLVMMYPVLAKVRYGQLDRVTSDKRLLVSSLVLNWLVGPAVMLALAWALLPDQ